MEKMKSTINRCIIILLTLVFPFALSAQTNVAQGKKAKQSSVAYGGNPDRAIDGNTDGQWGKKSVTHTQDERSAWWELDLGEVYGIDRIVIWNREDCCWERLQDFLVLTSETPIGTKDNVTKGDGMLKGPYSPWSANQKNFTIEMDKNEPKKNARYIRITLRQGIKDRPLSLAEVEVFGTPINSTTTTGSGKYKVGDQHPCGGTVVSVDDSGKKGFIAAEKDLGKYNIADGINASKALGEGWTLPNKVQLNQMYVNLYKKGLGNFQNAMYRTGQESGYPMYPWAQNFANGKQEGNGRNNLTLCRAIKEFDENTDCGNTTVATKNTLNAGETLKAGERLTSANGAYILRMQEEDGNLCVYKFANGKQGSFVWGSMKYGFKNGKLVMQGDGNLVVYDATNAAKWSSKTHPYYDAKFRNSSNKPVKLVLENDGRLNLYTAAGATVWSSR